MRLVLEKRRDHAGNYMGTLLSRKGAPKGVAGHLQRALVLLDVKAQQLVLVTDIKPAVGNDGMRPAGLATVVREPERALEVVPGRVGLNQGHDPILIAKIEV